MLFVVSVIPFNSAVVKMGLQTAANCLRLDRLTGSRSAPKGEQRIRVPDWESGTCALQTSRLLGSSQNRIRRFSVPTRVQGKRGKHNYFIMSLDLMEIGQYIVLL